MKNSIEFLSVFAMMLLREGDFAYYQDELDVMEQDIIPLKGILVDGFVFVAIHPAGTVDRQACLRWIRSAFPLPRTCYHK